MPLVFVDELYYYIKGLLYGLETIDYRVVVIMKEEYKNAEIGIFASDMPDIITGSDTTEPGIISGIDDEPCE